MTLESSCGVNSQTHNDFVICFCNAVPKNVVDFNIPVILHHVFCLILLGFFIKLLIYHIKGKFLLLPS